ncbi:hypothetical protein H0H87_006286 [Tephrocybe sp. NHM501043]|nr:hypothetical protein H0H87_006286 [Tephrocybe sp. NHM501043]
MDHVHTTKWVWRGLDPAGAEHVEVNDYLSPDGPLGWKSSHLDLTEWAYETNGNVLMKIDPSWRYPKSDDDFRKKAAWIDLSAPVGVTGIFGNAEKFWELDKGFSWTGRHLVAIGRERLDFHSWARLLIRLPHEELLFDSTASSTVRLSSEALMNMSFLARTYLGIVS